MGNACLTQINEGNVKPKPNRIDQMRAKPELFQIFSQMIILESRKPFKNITVPLVKAICSIPKCWPTEIETFPHWHAMLHAGQLKRRIMVLLLYLFLSSFTVLSEKAKNKHVYTDQRVWERKRQIQIESCK